MYFIRSNAVNSKLSTSRTFSAVLKMSYLNNGRKNQKKRVLLECFVDNSKIRFRWNVFENKRGGSESNFFRDLKKNRTVHNTRRDQ